MDYLESLPIVERARALLREWDDEILAELLELVQVPAPTFEEGTRASELIERFRALGVEGVHLDEVGNVLATVTEGDGESPPILVAAHLDTVFDIETDLRPRQVGERYYVPGISDNTRGLVALLALARLIRELDLETVHPLIFVGTVGEEGTGDLRGVKHLFREGSHWRDAAAFIAVDGTGSRRIVNRAIGSRRLRLTIEGPGGHSWADFGRVNPIVAASQAIADFGRYELPDSPRTTLSVGRIGGGTSVNAIPEKAWFELDLRSESGTELDRIESFVRDVIEEAIESVDRDRRGGTPALRHSIETIGDRPAGVTPDDAPLVEVASAATRAIGEVPELAASSTDANVPISIGLPAVTLGAGGLSGGAHTLEEWYENEGGSAGLERLLLTLFGIGGLVS